MTADDVAAWLRLSLTPGVGNQTARVLLTRFGLPENIFLQSLAELSRVVSPSQAQALRSPPQSFEVQLESTLLWLRGKAAGGGDATEPGEQRNTRRLLALGDAEYPEALLGIEDPPLLLYVIGRGRLRRTDSDAITPGPSAAESRPALRGGIAIVGSRNPTPQGEGNARQFAKTLAEAGLTVISGLALGIDGAAHGGALEATGSSCAPMPTLAVVGTGLDRVYPKQHLALARKICERGLLLSEYPLGTPPLAANFPRRNRLIAALSRGALVVEAAMQSGSLITARLAVEQGKEVFAIPGSIHSPLSRGCHALIRQGAKLVESAQDVLEELQWAAPGSSAPQHANAPGGVSGADPDEALLHWLGYDPVALDTLVSRSGISASDWQVQLLTLELAGRVARLPGGAYQRIAQA